MSEERAPDGTEARVPTKPFRKQFVASRLSPVSAERQGRAVKLAFEALGRDDATEFLNGHDAALGGRPLDLAVASAEGLAAVERAIAARKAGTC